jgi:hypothetical protein
MNYVLLPIIARNACSDVDNSIASLRTTSMSLRSPTKLYPVHRYRDVADHYRQFEQRRSLGWCFVVSTTILRRVRYILWYGITNFIVVVEIMVVTVLSKVQISIWIFWYRVTPIPHQFECKINLRLRVKSYALLKVFIYFGLQCFLFTCVTYKVLQLGFKSCRQRRMASYFMLGVKRMQEGCEQIWGSTDGSAF